MSASKLGSRAQCTELQCLIGANARKLRSNSRQLAESGDGEWTPHPPWSASRILGGGDRFSLWLGAVEDAADFSALREQRISAVVNMALTSCEAACRMSTAVGEGTAALLGTQGLRDVCFDEESYRRSLGCDCMYLAIDAQDHPLYPIRQHFEECIDFLNRCRAEERGVLVHCVAGVNRSAAVCVAFLMRSGIDGGEKLSLRQAVDWISSRRAEVLQNVGFLRQLVAYGSSDAESQGSDDAAADLKPVVPHEEQRYFKVGSVSERPALHQTRDQEAAAISAATRPRRSSRFKADLESRRHQSIT